MTNSRSSTVKVTSYYLSSDFITTSTSMVDVTGLTHTLKTTGNFIAIFHGTHNNGVAGSLGTINIMHNGSAKVSIADQYYANGAQQSISGMYSGISDGTILKLQGKTSADTLTLYGGSAGDTKRFTLTILEF